MSGGHFEYKQGFIVDIADEIERIISINNSDEVDRHGDSKSYDLSDELMREFKNGVVALRRAAVYAQRIDWLLSGDDGEDSFHRRLREELAGLESNK